MPSSSSPSASRAALLSLLVLGACRAPAPAPLGAKALASSVDARRGDPDQLASALALAGLAPFSIAPPSALDLADPRGAEFWHAWAWSSSPATRAARRRVEAARATARSAGRPEAIAAMSEIEELDDPAAHTRTSATFDLLGLLGLGPARSARELADARTRAALGELEQAVWAARFEVDLSRARLATARAVRARLRALQEESAEDLTRIDVLERHGRLAAGALAAARMALDLVAERDARLALEETQAREALALAAGLAPDAPALDLQDERVLEALLAERSADAPHSPDAEALLRRLPELRSTLLDYAVAEARLRHAAAQRWPSLRLGPHLLWRQPDLLLGALVGSQLPWPGALEGELEAARVEREAARERVEDRLLAARLRVDAARARLGDARARLEEGARPAAEASARLWSAARARFAIEPAALSSWADALGLRANALETLERSRGTLAESALELERALGPSADVPRLAVAPEVRP